MCDKNITATWISFKFVLHCYGNGIYNFSDKNSVQILAMSYLVADISAKRVTKNEMRKDK